MNPEQLPLKDIHLPEPVGWWPPALGWWLLALFVPLLIGLGYWLYKRITRSTALRSAKRILRQIQGDASRDDWQKVADISTLLRRTAISCYPREQVAGLTGQDWLLFLDRPFSSPRFASPLGQPLLEVPYRKQGTGEIPVAALLQLCEDWLRALDGQKR